MENKIFTKASTPYIIFAVLGLFLYFQSLFFDFTYLDDNVLILRNAYLLDSFANFFELFKSDVFNSAQGMASYYRPILNVSFMFDYQLGGISPFIYHFSNVILHILSVSLVYIFLQKLNVRKDLSFIFSLFFLIHPALSQAVSWIPGRNDTLLAVFLLSTFIVYLKYLDSKKWSHLLYALIFFTLSIFTKESALVILPLIFIYVFFVRRDDFKKISNYYFFLPTGVLSVIWFGMRASALKNSPPIILGDLFASVINNFPALIQLFGKVFLPFNLSVLPIMRDTTFIYGIISIVLFSLFMYFGKVTDWRKVIFGAIWFVVLLIPTFVRPNPNLPADFIEHRLYLPMVGLLIVLAQITWIRKFDFKNRYAVAILAVILITFGTINFTHSKYFADKLAFWNNAAENSPSYPLARRNLGAMEYLEGNFEKAEDEFKTALVLNPNEPMANNNLGLIYFRQGKFEDALDQYMKELEINPLYDDAHFNLALLYYQTERFAEAEEYWQKTLMINPNHVEALSSLLTHHYERAEYQKAIVYAEELFRRGYQIPQEMIETFTEELKLN
ncbi:MAG TPA: tetratricopeptide repeat protein [Candidatus Paceibacterota bacterium]|nr:tetratricopeptide repeat protein [Candidatus Paceibacterota bacterium]